MVTDESGDQVVGVAFEQRRLPMAGREPCVVCPMSEAGFTIALQRSTSSFS